MHVWVYIFSASGITHTNLGDKSTETQAQSEMPFLMPLGYSEDLICKDIKN